VLIRNAELENRNALDVRIRDGRIVELAPGLTPEPGEELLDAAGGALLPGLHDHHLHLLSLAAALESVACGPPQVHSRAELAAALGTVPGEGWIRGVGYHESVAGELDRRALDTLVGERPVRIQHRSGRLWMLSSAACRHLGLEAGDGRIFDADAELRARLKREDPPDLEPVGSLLASRGVTGVSDATAGNGPAEAAILADAAVRGVLPQRLRLMGGAELPEGPGYVRGERKLVLHEAAPPDFAALVADVGAAHRAGRGVAFHCVTRAELVLALAALEPAGVERGDRIEHASVAPPELVKLLAERRVSVVTQPGFVHERGDAYLSDVEPAEMRWLYRGRGFLEAGVPLGGGSDAPFGEADPWIAMRAAVDRRSAGGDTLCSDEALSPEEALALFTSPPEAPGGPPRRIEVGAPADLCLLDRPWSRARRTLSRAAVRATLIGGALVHRAE
jgi:predicted amidohydrolase YtcJ